MASFDSTEKIKSLKSTRMKIQYLRDQILITFCPLRRQLLQSYLFEEIEYTIRLTDELYRCLKDEHLTKNKRQTIEFTIEALSNFDGKGGRSAYVAVNGIVYDVSHEATWGGASHFGLLAGKDLTAQFNSCHGMMSILSKLPRVGLLK